MPAKRKRHRRAFADGELGDSLVFLALELDLRMKLDGIGPRHRSEAEIGAPDPRHRLAVAKADHELHAHRHSPAIAVHDAEEVDVLLVIRERHEVDQRDRPIFCLEGGLKNGRAVAIAARDPGRRVGRRDAPITVLLRAEQRGEAGIAVEARQA